MNRETKAWFAMLKELIHECPRIVIAGFLQGVIEGVRPFISIYLTALLVDLAILGAALPKLIYYAVLSGVVTVVLSFAHSIVQKTFNRNMEYMYERQTGPLAEKSMRMDYEYLEDARVHKLREEVSGFVPRFGLAGMVLDCMYHAMNILFTFLCALILIVPRLVDASQQANGFIGSIWFSLLFFACFFIINIIYIRKLKEYNMKKQELDEQCSDIRMRKNFFLNLYAKAESQKDIIMCNQGAMIMSEVQTINDRVKDNMKKASELVYSKAAKANVLSTISTLLVYIFSAIYGFYGIISIGSIVSFSASIKRVAEQLLFIGETYREFKYESVFAAKYMDFMQLKQRKHEGTIPMEKRQDNKFTVEFEHVFFKYPGAADYVIKDLNLKFIVGEKLAVVGKNGSGKSTFIKLLCRLYDVTQGCIKVNGIDIKKYDYEEYCRLFGVVFQDFTVFDFPLGESLACSTHVDRDRASEALSRAGMGERVKELSEGLETHIGKGFDEDGMAFSGGEKQKIAIARAIYKDAPFVIMDEPTAALDPEAEAEVFEGFDRMVGNKTAIYISHRLASCKFCEDILVFDKGQVVQHGNHEELSGEEGLYKKLWNAQARYYS